jgi:ADP-heptose:LPS heptosyltransferase
MVITTPFIAELQKTFPGANVDVLCSPANQSVLRNNPNVTNTPIWVPSFAGLRLLWQLRNYYDLVIDLNHSVIWRDMMMIRLLNPIWAASTYKAGRYGVTGSGLNIYRLMPRSECTWTESITGKYLNLIETLGGSPNQKFRYEIYPEDDRSQQVSAGTVLLSLESDFWVVNQFGGRDSMRLTDEDVREVTALIRRQDPDAFVLWASSPSTYQAVVRKREDWFSGDDHVVVYRPTQQAIDICNYLRKAKGLISPDTSLVHLACAFEKPMVVVFANERDLYKQWRPPSTNWQAHLFSKDSKSLSGYSSSELLQATQALLGLGSNNATPQRVEPV